MATIFPRESLFKVRFRVSEMFFLNGPSLHRQWLAVSKNKEKEIFRLGPQGLNSLYLQQL